MINLHYSSLHNGILRRPSQIWRSCKGSVFSCRVLRAYMVTNFLFVWCFFLSCVYIAGMGAGPCGLRGLCCVALSMQMNFLDFLDLSQLPKILSYRSFCNSSGDSYMPCLLLIITLRCTCGEKKILKILCPWLSEKFSLRFISLLTVPIVINSHILAKIFLIFIKNVLD